MSWTFLRVNRLSRFENNNSSNGYRPRGIHSIFLRWGERMRSEFHFFFLKCEFIVSNVILSYLMECSMSKCGHAVIVYGFPFSLSFSLLHMHSLTVHWLCSTPLSWFYLAGTICGYLSSADGYVLIYYVQSDSINVVQYPFPLIPFPTWITVLQFRLMYIYFSLEYLSTTALEETTALYWHARCSGQSVGYMWQSFYIYLF